MKASQAAEAYRTSTIENAPPVKVIRLLFEGALRFLDQAASLDPKDTAQPFASLVGRVDDIVVELRLCLEEDAAPELSENLERLYLYCEDELGRAIVDRDLAPLDRVREVLLILLDAWRQVEGKPL